MFFALFLATALWGGAWARLITVMQGPSPPRRLAWLTPDGAPLPKDWACGGAFAYRDDVFWKRCVSVDDQRLGIARLDLRRGEAKGYLLDGAIQAMAVSSTGEVALATSGAKLELTKINPAGVRAPLTSLRALAALEWDGNVLEAVEPGVLARTEHGAALQATIHAFGGRASRSLLYPDKADSVSTLELAYRAADGWHLVFSVIPAPKAGAPAADAFDLELFDLTEAAAPASIYHQRVDLPTAEAALGTLRGTIDPKNPRNPLTLARLSPKSPAEELPAGKLRLELVFRRAPEGALTWTGNTSTTAPPPLRLPEEPRWTEIVGGGALRIGDKEGPVLARPATYTVWPIVAPKTGGGSWVLLPGRQYLDVGLELQRMDPIDLVPRARLFVADPPVPFGRWQWAALAGVLLAFPVLLFFASLTNRVVRSPANFSLAARLYLVIALVFAQTFWRLSGLF